MMKVAFYDAKPYDRDFFSGSHEGLEFVFHPFRLSASTASTAEDCGAICAFVNDNLDRDCLEALAEREIRMIALRCAGFNNVDLEAAAEFGVPVTRVPAYSPHAVAEHAVALLLTLNRKIHLAYNRVRDHNFALDGLVGSDLHGKTAGIVGTGKIGRLLAQILRGFGMKVLLYDLYPNEDWARENEARYCDLDEIWNSSDVVSLHTPLTPETYRMVDAEALDRMKDTAILINTSRGKLISTRALIDALKAKKIGGVALDVYEVEEGVFFEDLSQEVLLDDDLARLVSFPNVLVTSHQGFLTREALSEIARVTTENLQRFVTGDEFITDTHVKS